jgi:hypothetical protein
MVYIGLLPEFLEIRKDRQFTYNVMLRRVCLTSVAVEK